jgi:hypothetical protein
MTQHIRNGQVDSGHSQHRLRTGLLVIDRTGATVGRIRRVHRADPLAVADDGRRIGQAGDFAAMLPGWSAHSLPWLPGATAARLVRDGYCVIGCGGPAPRQLRYAALTEIAAIGDETARLTVDADDLPSHLRRR